MTRLHVESYGSGVPAVFLHGSFGWGVDTFPEQRSLSDFNRIVLVDRVGFGRTPGDAAAGWVVDAPAVAALLAELGPVHLMGQSYGAVVAVLVAAQHPQLVRSLVVVEPPLYRLCAGDPAVEPVLAAAVDLARRASSLDTRTFVRTWITGVMRRPADSANTWMATWSDLDYAAADTTRREALAADAPIDYEVVRRARYPKVVVRGKWWPGLFPGREEGGAALCAVAAEVAVLIDADLREFDRSAHNPQIEQPDQFNDLLSQTWSNQGSERNDSIS